MSKKTLLILCLCVLILTTGYFAWKTHQAHQLSKSLAVKVPDINCALGCTHDSNFSTKVTTPQIPKEALTPPTPTINTCLESVTACLAKNGDLVHCADASDCSAACKTAIRNELQTEHEKRLEKLNSLFLSSNGACHTP